MSDSDAGEPAFTVQVLEDSAKGSPQLEEELWTRDDGVFKAPTLSLDEIQQMKELLAYFDGRLVVDLSEEEKVRYDTMMSLHVRLQ